MALAVGPLTKYHGKLITRIQHVVENGVTKMIIYSKVPDRRLFLLEFMAAINHVDC